MKNSTKILIGLVLLVVLINFIFLFFGEKITGLVSNEQKSDTIKIGVVAPLSGDISNWGSSVQGGVKLAVDEINPKGGINGKQIKVIYEDDQCDKAKAVSATQKLINFDDVKVIIGPMCSGSVLASAPVAESSHVVMIGFGSAAAISDAGDYVFRHTYSDAYQGRFLAGELYKLGFKKVNLIYVNNDYGAGLAQGFKTNFVNYGGEILTEEQYNIGTSDFRTILAKAKENSGESLVIIPYGSEGGLLVKQARELNMKLQIFSTDNFGTKEVLESGGSSTEGVIFSSSVPLDEKDSEIKEFKEKYVELNGHEPEILFVAASAYDAVKILENAISKVGYDSEKIKNYLYEMNNYEGLSGDIEFDENGDSTKAFALQKIQNGEFVTLRN